MSLSHWKELAQRKTKVGRAVNELYDDITKEKIRSKTTDQAIAKTFRLDRLDQIAEQTKPKQRRRVPLRPRVNADGGIDYAPEVDPYEEMDVEGLLNLEDYVPPQAEKQIAKPPPPPQYEMDPSFWQIPVEPPPDYSEIFDDDEQLALEAPPEEGDEGEDETNKILDGLGLPNYNDVEKRLAQPEMNYERRQKYLRTVLKNAEKRRKQVAAKKLQASNRLQRGEITAEEKKKIYEESDRSQGAIRELKNITKQRMKSFKGKGVRRGTQRGRGVVFYNNSKGLLEKLAVILGEMEARNTSLEMRNMGQTILDTLLEKKSINKTTYGKLVKKYFPL